MMAKTLESTENVGTCEPVLHKIHLGRPAEFTVEE